MKIISGLPLTSFQLFIMRLRRITRKTGRVRGILKGRTRKDLWEFCTG